MSKAKVGQIGWLDLTVSDAEGIRDFYQQVVGWEPQALAMGDYSDYNMTDAAGTPIAGVCHKRGVNAGIPSQWMAYFTVKDLDAKIGHVQRLGGEVLVAPTDKTGERVAIIRDPAGAVCALWEVPAEEAAP